MPSSDALIVVEDWISEHFFTTDARKESFQKLVLDRRKQWDGEDVPTTRTRFTERASKLATMLAALYPRISTKQPEPRPPSRPTRSCCACSGTRPVSSASAAMGQCDGSRRRASSSRRWPLSQPGQWRWCRRRRNGPTNLLVGRSTGFEPVE